MYLLLGAGPPPGGPRRDVEGRCPAGPSWAKLLRADEKSIGSRRRADASPWTDGRQPPRAGEEAAVGRLGVARVGRRAPMRTSRPTASTRIRTPGSPPPPTGAATVRCGWQAEGSPAPADRGGPSACQARRSPSRPDKDHKRAAAVAWPVAQKTRGAGVDLVGVDGHAACLLELLFLSHPDASPRREDWATGGAAAPPAQGLFEEQPRSTRTVRTVSVYVHTVRPAPPVVSCKKS